MIVHKPLDYEFAVNDTARHAFWLRWLGAQKQRCFPVVDTMLWRLIRERIRIAGQETEPVEFVVAGEGRVAGEAFDAWEMHYAPDEQRFDGFFAGPASGFSLMPQRH